MPSITQFLTAVTGKHFPNVTSTVFENKISSKFSLSCELIRPAFQVQRERYGLISVLPFHAGEVRHGSRHDAILIFCDKANWEMDIKILVI